MCIVYRMGKKDGKKIRYQGGGDPLEGAQYRAQKYKAKYLALRSRTQNGGAAGANGDGENADPSQTLPVMTLPTLPPLPTNDSISAMVAQPMPSVEAQPTPSVKAQPMPSVEAQPTPSTESPDDPAKLGETVLSNWVNREDKVVIHTSQDDDGNEVTKEVTITSPVHYYGKMVKRYGEPNYLVNKPGGVAKWMKNDGERGRTDLGPHEFIMLKDEFVQHDKPREHYDFMYSIIKVYIPPEKLVDVIKISGSINYDPLYKNLRARCSSFAANFATFKTVYDTLEGSPSSYGENIDSKEDSEEQNEEITKLLIEKYGLDGQYGELIAKAEYDLESIPSGSGVLGLGL